MSGLPAEDCIPFQVTLDPEERKLLKQFCDSLPEECKKQAVGDETVETVKEKWRLCIKGLRAMDKNDLAASYFLNAYPDKEMCFMCGASQKEIRPTSMKRCGRCKKAYYCSVTCQHLHWDKLHRTECVRAALNC